MTVNFLITETLPITKDGNLGPWKGFIKSCSSNGFPQLIPNSEHLYFKKLLTEALGSLTFGKTAIKGSLSNDDGNGNENSEKAIGLNLRNSNFAITLFCTFLSRHCTTTTWKCLISHFVEDGNTQQQLSFSFPVLWYSALEFNSKTFYQHWMN